MGEEDGCPRECYQCNLASLYPDGLLRCDLTGLVPRTACIQRQYGKCKVRKVGDLLKERALIPQQMRTKKVIIRTVTKPVKSEKGRMRKAPPKEQRRLL